MLCWFKIISISFAFIWFSFLPNFLTGQEIDFGDYSSTYSITISELSPGLDFYFGFIPTNTGTVQVPIEDAKILTIVGVNYLDVIIDITADSELLLDGDLDCIGDSSCSIDYTLKAAYNNRGIEDSGTATTLTVIGNIASAQFPVLYRGDGPPGPPPTPVYDGYDPNSMLYQETAYIYLYGDINVGAVNSGSYTGNVSVLVYYD